MAGVVLVFAAAWGGHLAARFKLRSDWVDGTEMAPAALAATSPLGREVLLREEKASAIRDSIAPLRLLLRAVLVLSVYEELAQAEIAAVTHLTVKTVETRLARARQKLRVALAAWA